MLQAQSLTCRRGGREIFREVSFALDAGQALLITGANGSGKSSLLRILSGLILPVSGSIMWRGQRISDEPEVFHRNLHYVGHLDAVKQELTVAETLDYWRVLFGQEMCVAPSKNDPFGVMAFEDKPVRYLSAGQKRRLALSRLLLREAPLWILDEPTTALDHEAQNILFECFTRHCAEGGIVIVATHQGIQLPGVQSYCMSRERS